jgi:hypothetical protein
MKLPAPVTQTKCFSSPGPPALELDGMVMVREVSGDRWRWILSSSAKSTAAVWSEIVILLEQDET